MLVALTNGPYISRESFLIAFSARASAVPWDICRGSPSIFSGALSLAGPAEPVGVMQLQLHPTLTMVTMCGKEIKLAMDLSLGLPLIEYGPSPKLLADGHQFMSGIHRSGLIRLMRSRLRSIYAQYYIHTETYNMCVQNCQDNR